MKTKLITIVLLMPILIFSFLMVGCVDQGMKKELIEFDKQYYAIIYESAQAKEGFSLRAELQQIGDIDLATQGDEVEAIMKKLSKDYEYMLSNLESLKIPEPLKEYNQKITQDYKNSIVVANIYIDTLGSYKNGSLTEEKNQQNNKEIQDLLAMNIKLEEECDKIIIEIYRKYGLDYLLTKIPTFTLPQS